MGAISMGARFNLRFGSRSRLHLIQTGAEPSSSVGVGVGQGGEVRSPP